MPWDGKLENEYSPLNVWWSKPRIEGSNLNALSVIWSGLSVAYGDPGACFLRVSLNPAHRVLGQKYSRPVRENKHIGRVVVFVQQKVLPVPSWQRET